MIFIKICYLKELQVLQDLLKIKIKKSVRQNPTDTFQNEKKTNQI